MKTLRNLIAAASAAVFVLAGCQEEIFNQPVESDNYYASAEAFTADTKTALGQGRSVVWSAGDQIAIFEGTSAGKAYQVVDAAVGSNSGEFALVGDLCTDTTSEIDGNTIAVYPFDKSLTASAGENDSFEIGGITFPSRQAYTSGSFCDEAFPMAALTQEDSKSLSFKNIGGVIKLSLTGICAVREISIHGHSDEPLSGPATATLSPDGIPSVNMSSEASKSVTLVCDPAIQLDSQKATDFFISIPPTEFKAGFTVTITDSEGNESTKSTDKANNVLRSTILAMPGFSQDEMEEVTYTISEIAEDVVNIDEYVSPIFSECDNIGQLSQHLGNIQRIDGVKEAWTTNTSLYIRTKGGLTMSWTYTLDESSYDISETQTTGESVKPMVARSAMTKSSSYVNHDSVHDYHNVCIINQQYNDDSRKKYLEKYDNLASKFENNGFGKVERIDGYEADLEFFTKDITKYDIIFLVTHGGYDDRGNHWIATGEEASYSDRTDIAMKIREWCKISGESTLINDTIPSSYFSGWVIDTIDEVHGKDSVKVKYIGISEEYITKRIQGRFDNTIIFNTACQSLSGTTDERKLAMAFQGKGAALYLGYDDINEIGKEAGPQFFNNMINGMTVEEAFDKLDKKYHEDVFYYKDINAYVHASLKYLPEANKDICIAHLTPVTKDTTMVKGTTRLNGTFETPVKGQFENYELGFCYSYTTSTPTVEDSEVIYVENSEIRITENTDYYAELKDIKHDETCCYRFFFKNPHSGEYVYGDTKSFELEMDKWVDLGLPSGILWAAWNVGANSPEEYGGYYAWGETEDRNTLAYKIEDYKYYNSSTGKCMYLGAEISGTSYDVAHVKWGGGARMPTYEEAKELVNNCTMKGEWKDSKFIGMHFIGPNGNSIYLPFAGVKARGGTLHRDHEGYYWTSTYNKSSDKNIYVNSLLISTTGKFSANFSASATYTGRSVRPVKTK